MVERPIPQDILKYKQKAIGNFSAREVIFGGIGLTVILICSLTVFKDIASIKERAILSAIPALPLFAIGFIKLYGLPLEKILFTIILDNFINPIKRKKEVHYKEFEKREKTRKFILEIEEKNKELPKKKQKKLPKLDNKKPICKASKTLKGYK